MSNDSTTALFGLTGIAVVRVDREPDGRRVVHARTNDVGAAACPQCGVFSASPRQSRTTRPRDVPFGEDALVVRWHENDNYIWPHCDGLTRPHLRGRAAAGAHVG